MACGLGCERITDEFYRAKLHSGLILDPFGRRHAPSPGQPPFEALSEDGWLALAGPEPDLIDQLMGWDEKQLRAFEARR